MRNWWRAQAIKALRKLAYPKDFDAHALTKPVGDRCVTSVTTPADAATWMAQQLNRDDLRSGEEFRQRTCRGMSDVELVNAMHRCAVTAYASHVLGMAATRELRERGVRALTQAEAEDAGVDVSALPFHLVTYQQGTNLN